MYTKLYIHLALNNKDYNIKFQLNNVRQHDAILQQAISKKIILCLLA